MWYSRPKVILFGLVLFNAALATSCQSEDVTPSLKTSPIVGGSLAPSGLAPAAGALIVNYPGQYQVFCSATLIAPRWVLTAAHCLSQIPSNIPIGFFYGTNLYGSGASAYIIAVTQAHLPQNYTGGTPPSSLSQYYDIAMLQLEKAAPIEPARVIRPAEVANNIKFGTKVLLVGYGLTSANAAASDGRKYYGESTIAQVGAAELWVHQQSGPQKCNGDSGGPTFIDLDPGPASNLRVIGVASRAGEFCTMGSVETRVDSYLNWIHGIAELPCDSGLSKPCTGTPPSTGSGTSPTPAPTRAPIGSACSKAADCADNLCVVAGAQGTICAKPCAVSTDKCQQGYRCHAIANTNQGACIAGNSQPKLALGKTCKASTDCQSNLCATDSAGTKFCTQLCDPAQPSCGDSMTCRPAGGDKYACALLPSAGLDGAKAAASTNANDNDTEGLEGGCNLMTAGRTSGWSITLGLVAFFMLMTRRQKRTRLNR